MCCFNELERNKNTMKKEAINLIKKYLKKDCVVKSYRLSDIKKDFELFLHLPVMNEFVLVVIQVNEHEETYLIEDKKIINLAKKEKAVA